VGEVASSNLVVPTIYWFLFNELAGKIWVHLIKVTFILSLIGPICLGPICPHLIDLFRIAFFVPILPTYR
jgi:hypothetical protein